MKTVWALLALNAALAGAIALSWPDDEAAHARPGFGLPGIDVLDRFEIRRTGQADVLLKRTADGWTADGAPIDPYALADLEAAFAAPIGSDQAAPADALDRYGLGEHALTVTLRGGRAAQTIRVGKGVDGRRTFVWPVGSERVYRLRADLRRVFDRPAVNWRERRLFARQAVEVAAMRRVVGERVEWVARRSSPEAPWTLTEPAPEGGAGEGPVPAPLAAPVEAGQRELDAVANTLATANASAFVAGAGFQPLVTLHGETFDGEVFALELGPVAEDGSRAARVAGQAAVVTLPRHQAVFLGATADDLRERRVFDAIEPGAVEAVAIAGEPEIRLVRDGQRWRMTAPVAQPASPMAAEGWVEALLGVKAAGFVDAAPPDAFDEVARRVALRLSGDRQVELVVGAVWQGRARYARTSDRPERVVVLGAATVEALRPAPAVFTDGPRDGPGQPPVQPPR